MEVYQHVRSFILAALEYTKRRSKTTASVLQRDLRVISLSLDLRIFDPGTSISAEFYVSLHELMDSIGSRTTLMWSAVDVLQNACRNTAARQALIHTYKFTPILTRLLELNLTAEKKMRALKLLQELTYGIKILWQEAHLFYLIKILTIWVMESKEEEIIAVSLGILVNLCYKNLPAVYILMRTINIKAFIGTLLKILSGNLNTRVQCCKLLIILEHNDANISEKYILNFVMITFTSLITALKQKDLLLLRHVIDFFDDVGQNQRSRSLLLNYPNYSTDVKNILSTLESNSDPECISLIMEFLLSLVKLKLSILIPLYPICVKSAMAWVPVEQVCSKALALIRIIVIDSQRNEIISDVLAELDASSLMLFTVLKDEEVNKENEQYSAETQTRLAELMQLFQEMIKIPALKPKVLHAFNEQAMRKLLKPLLDRETSAGGDWPGNLIQHTGTNLYVHALTLTADLAANNSNWLTLYSELLSNKQIQMVMALALFTGDGDVKQKVLKLALTVGYTQECVSAVALCMRELEPLVVVQCTTGSAVGITGKMNLISSTDEMALFFSFPQEERLDTFILKLEAAFETNQIGDITTSAVMELYAYKLAAMRHAERAMQLSLEAANNRAISLQHRLAQVVVESSRLHQLLFDTQQSLEGTKVEKVQLRAKLCDAEEQYKTAHILKKQEIDMLKEIVTNKSANLEQLTAILVERTQELEATVNREETLNKQIKEVETKHIAAEAKAEDMSTKNHELSKLLHEMEESLNKKEQIIATKTAEIEVNEKDISALKEEIQHLTQMLYSYEQNIAEKEGNIHRMKAELNDLSRIRDMIFVLTAKKKDDLNTS